MIFFLPKAIIQVQTGLSTQHVKGQTNSKWIFHADVSSKKTNEQIRFYYLSTCFRSYFGRKWRDQKYISKLTDL